jgi:hypothetical protein
LSFGIRVLQVVAVAAYYQIPSSPGLVSAPLELLEFFAFPRQLPRQTESFAEKLLAIIEQFPGNPEEGVRDMDLKMGGGVIVGLQMRPEVFWKNETVQFLASMSNLKGCRFSCILSRASRK